MPRSSGATSAPSCAPATSPTPTPSSGPTARSSTFRATTKVERADPDHHDPGQARHDVAPPHVDRAGGGRRGRGLGPGLLLPRRGRRSSTASSRSSSATTRRCTTSAPSRSTRRPGSSAPSAPSSPSDAQLDWTTLGFGGGNGKVFLESTLDGRVARQGHRRLRRARPPAPGLRHARGSTRRRTRRQRPRLPRPHQRPLVGRLARDDQGRPGRPAHRRLPGGPQPPARQEGPRRRDPGPGDPRRRRPLHPCGGSSPRSIRSRSSTCARAGCRETTAERLVVEGFLGAIIGGATTRVGAGRDRGRAGAAAGRGARLGLRSRACGFARRPSQGRPPGSVVV